MTLILSSKLLLFGTNRIIGRKSSSLGFSLRKNGGDVGLKSCSSWSFCIQNSFKSFQYRRNLFTSNRLMMESSFYESKINESLGSKIKETIKRYESLNEILSSPSVDGKKARELAKELGSISSTHYLGVQWLRLNREVIEYENSMKEEQDDALKELIKEELKSSLETLETNESELISSMIEKDPDDERDAILEVRAGAGGDEASLFAQDMLNMYEKYCGEKGWRFKLLSSSASGVHGIKEATASIKGEGAFGRLRHETGVHRVQRVPETETMGRTHTSTMTVAVLPEAQDADVQISEKDLRIDVYRSSGAGGQHVNTTESAVRITHIPTGTVVAIQDERSQLMNKDKAMQVLRSRLFEAERRRLVNERNSQRSSQIGSGERNERIRTYNFAQGRVTDHRSSTSVHDITGMMDGIHLDEFIDSMIHEELKQAIENLKKSK